MKLRKAYTCPLELTHDMIRGKWKPIILWRLRLGNTSLSTLERDIEGISQKMLIQHLNELIFYGLADKKTFNTYPLKVEYFLTETMGRQIISALSIMQGIGIDYMMSNNMEEILKEKNLI